jgi:cell division cycle 14
MLEGYLNDPALRDKRIIHCCNIDEPEQRTNAAYLICAYLVVVKRIAPDVVFLPFAKLQNPLLPYRDTSGSKDFELSVLDCLQGLQFAVRLNLFDWTKFDVELYEHFGQVENGDLNWIIPGKLLAFAGPHPSKVSHEHGFPTFTPEDYVQMFLDVGIRMVVRLSRGTCSKKRFTDHGIKHEDLYFADGECPSPEIVSKFLRVTERERGPCAVHCKSGLGRTGTLIGLFAMKHLGFPARAYIGWSRICRPGSVIGGQQHYLEKMQATMFQARVAMNSLPRAAPSLTPEELLAIQQQRMDSLCRWRQ